MLQIEFSVDDVIGIWKDLTKNAGHYHSIFENKDMLWLKALHKKSGMVITLFAFYECSGFDLTMMPDCYKKEWMRNSDWLRIGFHSKNENSDYERTPGICKKDYQLFREQVIRFAGESSLSDSIKLHRFASTHDVVDAIAAYEKDIHTWVCADDFRKSYGMNARQNFCINATGVIRDATKGICYRKTAFRLESSEIISLLKILWYKRLAMNPVLFFFTHECYMQDEKLRRKTDRLLRVMLR